MTLGASPDSDYSRELKVSSWEGPLETYYWLLSRWLDVFKGLLHSNRIQSHCLYLLLSQENGKRKDGMFVLGIVNFILPGWPGATNSLNLAAGNWVLQQDSEQVTEVHGLSFSSDPGRPDSKRKSTSFRKQEQQHGKSHHSYLMPTWKHEAALANYNWMSIAVF